MPTLTVTGTANQQAIPASGRRKSLSVTNTDSTNTVFLRANRVNSVLITTTANEFALAPGASFNANLIQHGADVVQSSFQAIASGGSPVIQWGDSTA